MQALKYVQRTVAMEQLMSRYRFESKFMELCRQCPNYDTNWACPPYDFDTGAFLSGFTHACVFAATMAFDDDTYEKMAEDKSFAESYIRGCFKEIKSCLSDLLDRLEEKYPGSRGVAAGGCGVCSPCLRATGGACVSPRQARYSLESLGLDVSLIAEDLFGIRLEWFKDKPPRSQTLVHALLTSCDPGPVERDLAAFCAGG